MAEFNFTIRATDTAGAFSDRDFSINVRNTIAEQFVATTISGNIMTSVDGINWNFQLGKLAAGYNYGDVINANGVWLIQKNANTYLRSVDAINWVEHSWPTNYSNVSTSVYNLSKFAYGDGKIAIVLRHTDPSTSASTLRFMTSVDGITWDDVSTLTFADSNDVSGNLFCKMAYGNGTWIMIDSYSSTARPIGYRSTDGGETWTPTGTGQRSTALNHMITNMYYHNGVWLATTISSNTGLEYYLSNDGITWRTYPKYMTGSPTTLHTWSVLYGNGRIVTATVKSDVISNINDWNSVYISDDLENWTNKALGTPKLVGDGITGSANKWTASDLPHPHGVYHNGKFVLCGGGASYGTTIGGLYYSYDGESWTHVPRTEHGSTNLVKCRGIAALRPV